MTEFSAIAKGNQTDLANRLRVSRQAVSQMVKKGIIQREPDGKIFLDQAVEDWYALAEVGQQRPFKKSGKITASFQRSVERYHKARAQREEYQAKLAQLEYEEKAGTFINAEKTKKHLVDAIVATRNGILNVPRTVSVELVGIQEEAVIMDKLNQALEIALLALSENVLKGA